jgi:hypothetical protein
MDDVDDDYCWFRLLYHLLVLCCTYKIMIRDKLMSVLPVHSFLRVIKYYRYRSVSTTVDCRYVRPFYTCTSGSQQKDSTFNKKVSKALSVNYRLAFKSSEGHSSSYLLHPVSFQATATKPWW